MSIDVVAHEFDVLVHFTPSTEERRTFAKSGVAMPDGSFYIRNRSDLSNAIRAVGRSTPNANESDVSRRNSVRRHIIKRAKALNLSNMIPDTWNSDGTLKQTAIQAVEDFLIHFGVLGMRWGVHRSDGGGGTGGPGRRTGFARRPASAASSANHPSLNASKPRISSDAATARMLQGTVKKGGTQSLSNKELQQLVTRMNLERQYSSLNPAHVSAGRKFVSELGKDVAKQSAQSFIRQYGPKGLKWIAKKAALPLTSLMVRGALAAL